MNPNTTLYKSFVDTTHQKDSDARFRIDQIESMLQPYKILLDEGKTFTAEKVIQKMIEMITERPTKEERTTQLEREVSKL
jgi:hypothetical protein